MSSKPIRGVLFDMDDTLIDWHGFDGNWPQLEQKHIQGVYQFLQEVGHPPACDANQLVATYGSLVREAWADARTTLRAPHMGKLLMQALSEHGVTPNEVVTEAACLRAYDWGPIPGVVLFPDVPAGLEAITQRDLEIGIVTNAFQPMYLRDAELEAYGILQYFPDAARRISAADVGYLKPNAKIFEYALQQLGTKADETLYIGDNPVADIAGAQAAGLRAVLRINHATPPLISGLIVPDAAINGFDELLLLLDDWDTFATAH